jgi:hypothetical protein
VDAAPAATPSRRFVEVSTSVAVFDGDELAECVSATVRVPSHIAGARPGDASGGRMTPRQASMLLVEDVLIAVRGGDAMISSSREQFTKGTRAMLSGQVALPAEFRGMEWPMPSFAEEAKRGDITRVLDCISIGRVPTGRCAISDYEHDAEREPLSWSVVRRHYDWKAVAESDAAMKRCLALGGSWWASDASEAAASGRGTRSRLRRMADGVR